MISKKFLKKVILSSDVYAVCVQHALTTEKQEIMGMLIGEVDEETCISHISACVILHRSDKQPDRVEISPEQLYTASEYAEKLSHRLNRPMRVLGWYHSHPHITVWPSHVDLRTQWMYQTMDSLFVGLIFSVFQTDTAYDSKFTKNNFILTCFQAHEGMNEIERREVDLVLKDCPVEEHNVKDVAKLPQILVQEEVDCYADGDNNIQDELAQIHNESFKTLALVHIVSKVARPQCDVMVERLKVLREKTKTLEKYKSSLQKELQE